jgi:hypothetical protein
MFKKATGLILFLICALLIFQTVKGNENWQQLCNQVLGQIKNIPIYKWFFLLFLMIINFFVESLKWFRLIKNNNQIQFGNTFKSVMVGQAFAFFTPNRMGEYLGRILYLDKGSKMQGAAQMAWSSFAQLIVTLCIGSMAILFFTPIYPSLRWISPLLGVVTLFFYFYKIPFLDRFTAWSLIQIKTSIKVDLLLLSLGRYLIFSFQYLWVANILNLPIESDQIFVAVSILFLCLSILPTISVTELVVRGQLLIFILAPIYTDSIRILSLSSIIWLINFLIPSIIGAFILIGYRYKQ